MSENPWASRVLPLAVLFILAAFAPCQQAPQASAQSTSAHATAAASPEASKYVGAETCKTCHEEIYNSWEKTPHWKTTLNKAGGPAKLRM